MPGGWGSCWGSDHEYVGQSALTLLAMTGGRGEIMNFLALNNNCATDKGGNIKKLIPALRKYYKDLALT